MSGFHRISIFIFIDAFGWELLQRHGFLDDLLTTRAPLETVLGYSSTCDPTIITGRQPSEHGHFSFFRYDPPNSPFGPYAALGKLPAVVLRRGRVRRLLSRLLKRRLGYTGYFQLYNMPFHLLPLFDYSEKRDIYQPGGINGGVPTVFDHLRTEQIPYHLSDWEASEETNLHNIETAIDERHVSFAYLYLAAMDALLHAQGTRAPAVAAKIRWYEQRIRHLIEQARRRYDEVRIFAFSDHGMTDVHLTCDLMARIDRLGLEFGLDYAAVYDSTMARFWFLRDGVRERIVEALAQESMGEILHQDRLDQYGCSFPDHRYGELFFLLHPGALINPSFMGEQPLAGMHGYEPTDPSSLAMFASSVRPDPLPGKLTDLYSLMCREADGG